MNFSEQPPSKEWAVLKYRGEKIAEVWFKPEGEPLALTFRIPRSSFQIPNMGQLLTAQNLLGAVGVSKEEVESWDQGDASSSGMDGSNPELEHPLSPPPQDVTHLTIHVRLRPPTRVDGREESAEAEIPPEKWQEFKARWNAILVLEATIDTLRISMEGLRAEMDGAANKSLTADEKVHALNADVAQWNQAKSRLLFGVPKVRDYIHRSTWAKGAPERKKLEELFQNDHPPHVSVTEMDILQRQLDNLLKDRQILSGQGTAVYQECKRLAADVQGILRNLQSNAAANASKKRAELRARLK